MSVLIPDRNLALELVRVTESGAMGAGRWIGRGDKHAADQAAVDAMRGRLDSVSMDGVVAAREGTRLCALGQPNARGVMAVAERGTMFFAGAAFSMAKIAVGPEGI